MDTLGIDTSPEEIDLMIHEIDQDSNGEIDFEGIVRSSTTTVRLSQLTEELD